MSSKIDGVPRELLDNLLHCGTTSSFITPATTAALRALLAKSDDSNKVNNRQMGLMQFVEKHAAPVVERQPFFYGIMQPDGKPHYSELCVSGEASDLESEAESMSEDSDGEYYVVALYTAPPELAELQATIARLTELINEVVEKQSYELEHRGARYRARWEETLQKLKSETNEGKSHE